MMESQSALKKSHFDRFSYIFDLQEMLNGITENSYEEVKDYIDNHFFRAPTLVEALVHEIFAASKFFHDKNPLYARLVANITRRIKENTNYEFFKPAFWDELKRSHRKYPNFCFVRHCFDQKAFTVDEIIEKIFDWPRDTPEFSYFVFFGFFAVDIFEHDTDVYNDLFSNITDNSRKLTPGQRFIFNQWQSLCWEGFRFLYDYGCLRNTLAYILKFNRIGELRDLTKRTDFDLDQVLLDNPFDPVPFLKYRPTLLQFAAYYGSVQCYRHLIRCGVKLEERDKRGYTVLEYALAGGHQKIIDSLLNKKLKNGPNILIPAKFRRNDLLVYLYNTGKFGTQQLYNALHKCASTGNILSFRYILDQGLDINHVSNTGFTFLIDAIENDEIELAKICLDADCFDVNAQEESGNTALHIAVLNNNIKSVKLLLDCPRTNAKIKTKFCKEYPIHLAATIDDTEILRTLARRFPETVNEKDANGFTPLRLAVKHNKPKNILCLLEIPEIDLTEVDEDNNTCLHYATDMNNTELAEMLACKRPETVNLQNKEGLTPMMLAVLNDNYDLTYIFYRFTVTDLTIKDKEGFTAAEMAESPKLVELFNPTEMYPRKHKKKHSVMHQ